MPHRHKHPVNQQIYDNASRSDRAVTSFVGYFGSLRYLAWQTVVIIAWIIVNALELTHAIHFDPYPFILLNLVFSTQAAYAAPVILLAQNKAADRDRIKAENDYATNETALAEIRADKELTVEVHRLVKLLTKDSGEAQ